MTLRALTIWQPWAWAITIPAPWGKDVENRAWPPPESAIGEPLAIHAGQKVDRDAIFDCLIDPMFSPLAVHVGEGEEYSVEEAKEHGFYFDEAMQHWYVTRVPTDPDEYVRGAVVAVAKLAGARRGDGPMAYSRWHSGPVGWHLGDRVPIEPVKCRGAQGLFTLDVVVENAVRRRAGLQIVPGEPAAPAADAPQLPLFRGPER